MPLIVNAFYESGFKFKQKSSKCINNTFICSPLGLKKLLQPIIFLLNLLGEPLVFKRLLNLNLLNKQDSIMGRAESAIGSKIKSLREMKQITLEDLAHQSGLKLQYMSAIEEDMQVPTIGELIQITRVLGVSSLPLSSSVSFCWQSARSSNPIENGCRSIGSRYFCFNQLHFFTAGQLLNGIFPFQGRGIGVTFFRIHQFQWSSATGIFGAFSTAMGFQPFRHVIGDTAV